MRRKIPNRQCQPQEKINKLTNIHHKISVHFERPLVQRFSEKIRVLFFGRYIDYLEFAVCHTLPNKMVANVNVLRVGGVAEFLAR